MAIKIAGTTVIDDSRNITTDVGTVDGVDIAQLKIDFDNSTGLADLVDDTSPQLGGELDTNGNDIYLPDNAKIKLGNGSDLQIYHNESHSIIKDNGTGDLLLQGNASVKLQGAGDASNLIIANQGAAVTLYHNNSPRIETTAAGVSVAGNVAVSGTVDGVDIAARDGVLTSTTTTANAALPKAGGTITGDTAITNARLTISDNTDALCLYSASNGVGVNLKMSDAAAQSQSGTIKYVHQDGSSYGSGNAFIVASSEASMTFLADGKLMYNEGIYSKPATGTGAGTRKDANWDTAYTTANAALPKAGGAMTGAITTNSTFDGRDVSADGEKLDGIATGANNYTFPHSVSSVASNNTLVKRSGDGYIFGSYYNGTGTFANSASGGTMGMFTGTNGNDNYGRSWSAAQARTLLNVENGATADQTAAQLLAAIKTVDVDGSAGLNAGRLDGHALTTASTGSTVVERDGSGDIKARLFRSEYDTTNASIGYFMTQTDTSSNNYIRPSTAAQVRAALNVEDGATAGGGFSATSATGTTPSLNVGNDTFFNHGKDTGNTTVSFTNVPTEASWKYSYQPAVISGAWDIDTRTIKDTMAFTSWETVPTGMHIDSTGTKLFIVGTGADGVNRFDLTVPWDPRSAVFHSESASFVNLDASFQDIFISPDGDEMFLIGDGGNAVHRWNMDVPFDVTDLSGRVTFGTGAQDTTVRGLTFSPDGTKMYVAGGQYNRIYHYTLSNAFSFSPQPAYQGYKTVPEGDPSAVFFKPDGTKMFVGGYTTDTVYAYDLSTAWDVTSASDDTSITIQNWQGNMSGLFFSPGGEYMYIIGNTGDRISRFSVGTLSTLTLPSSVDGVVAPVDPFARCTLEFVTLNGGTDVMLVNQSTIGLST